MRDHAAGPTQRAAPMCAVMGCRRRIAAQRLGACVAAAVLGVVLACCASLAQEVVDWPEGSYTTIEEGADRVPIKLYLTVPIERGFTVQWGATPVTVTGLGSAADEADYEPASGRHPFPPNTPAEKRFTIGHIEIVDDDEEEGLETFEVQLIAVVAVGQMGDELFIQLGPPLRFAIAPSDPVTLLPTLSISDASASEGDDASFTVTLSELSEDDVTVQWVTARDATAGANAADAGLDYTAVTTLQTLTIPAGQRVETFTVQTLEDELDEPDETFLARLSSPMGATITRAEGTGTIVDDDLPPTLSINDARAVEGNAVTFTVTRSGAAGHAVSVQLMTAPDGRPGAIAADAGDDYTAVTRTLDFAAGETEMTIPVPTLEDEFDEPDETFLARLSSPMGATITRAEGTGTIEDDDLPPTLSINDARAAEGEDVIFTVTLSAAAGEEVSVQWETAPDRRAGANAAQAGLDYTAVTPSLPPLTFEAGETEKMVDVWTFFDDIYESDETFLVRLSDPMGATITRGEGVGTIEDDDLPPVTLSINDAAAVEGEDVVFTVTRSGAADSVVSVQWMTAPDDRPGANPAQAGADYTPMTMPQALVFAAGESEKTVAVRTIEDDLHEPDETFLARLSEPVGATIVRGTGVGTIVDAGLPPPPSTGDPETPEETDDPGDGEEVDDPGDVEKVDDGGAVEKVEEEAPLPTLSINDAGAPEGEDAVF
ncbi:MAG: hypothetical protein OXP66_08255, partial [Candidatus Tectomicrobia bacterium]|nr:hypothetical protein [Candidatus Tectomicrobia bacterium]